VSSFDDEDEGVSFDSCLGVGCDFGRDGGETSSVGSVGGGEGGVGGGGVVRWVVGEGGEEVEFELKNSTMEEGKRVGDQHGSR